MENNNAPTYDSIIMFTSLSLMVDTTLTLGARVVVTWPVETN